MARRTKCLLLLLVAGVGGFAGFAAWDYAMTPEPGVTLENYRLLRQRMSLAEAEAILGPAHEGPRRLDDAHYYWIGPDGLDVILIFQEEYGLSQGYTITHRPDGTDRVIPSNPPTGPSLLDTIRSLLHL